MSETFFQAESVFFNIFYLKNNVNGALFIFPEILLSASFFPINYEGISASSLPWFTVKCIFFLLVHHKPALCFPLVIHRTSPPPFAAPPPPSRVVSALLSASPAPVTSASPGFSFSELTHSGACWCQRSPEENTNAQVYKKVFILLHFLIMNLFFKNFPQWCDAFSQF